MAVRSEDLFQRDAQVVQFPSRDRRPSARRLAAERRVEAQRRAVASVLAVVLAGILFFLATGPEGNALASRSEAPKAVTLQSGDTLWDIAERYAAPGQDPRAYVHSLIEINDLGPVPQVGERLKLPR